MHPTERQPRLARWTEPFLLRRAERLAELTPSARRHEVALLLRSATTRLQAARDLQDAAAPSLYRDAIGRLIAALALAHGVSTSAHAAMASEPSVLLGALRDRLPTGRWELVSARLEPEDSLRWDRDPAGLAAAIDELRQSAQWLRAQVEPRTAPQVRRQRWLRLALLMGMALGAFAALAAATPGPGALTDPSGPLAPTARTEWQTTTPIAGRSSLAARASPVSSPPERSSAGSKSRCRAPPRLRALALPSCWRQCRRL